MLLTKRSTGGGGATPSALVGSLARGVSRAIPTMDRRAFLRRSGLGVGAGLAASQLTLVRKAEEHRDLSVTQNAQLGLVRWFTRFKRAGFGLPGDLYRRAKGLALAARRSLRAR